MDTLPSIHREAPKTTSGEKNSSKEDIPSFHTNSGYKSAYHTKRDTPQEEPAGSAFNKEGDRK